MFDANRFRAITVSEQEIIGTNEYKQQLPDYEDLSYDETLCCRPVVDNKKKTEFKHIWYADFESIINVNPHKAYLCCVVDAHGMQKVFRGFNCAANFLNSIPNKTLIYFHNLKYDASFFMNVFPNEYRVKIIERTGTILQLQFYHIKKLLFYYPSSVKSFWQYVQFRS